MTSENIALNNLEALQKNIKDLCLQNNRDKNACRLLPVTKTVPSSTLRHLILNGHSTFGENKVQEIKLKNSQLSDLNPKWHMIGNLQTNKVKDCIDHIELLHSVDRISLAEKLESELQKRGRSLDILVQVNTSGEASKFGTSPESTIQLIKDLKPFETLNVKGLMTLAIFSGDEIKVRQCFKILKNLSDTIKNEGLSHVEMRELSMGMSSDYKIAIEEGSTIVRVGTTIFGKRPTPDSIYWPEEK